MEVNIAAGIEELDKIHADKETMLIGGEKIVFMHQLRQILTAIQPTGEKEERITCKRCGPVKCSCDRAEKEECKHEDMVPFVTKPSSICCDCGKEVPWVKQDQPLTLENERLIAELMTLDDITPAMAECVARWHLEKLERPTASKIVWPKYSDDVCYNQGIDECKESVAKAGNQATVSEVTAYECGFKAGKAQIASDSKGQELVALDEKLVAEEIEDCLSTDAVSAFIGIENGDDLDKAAKYIAREVCARFAKFATPKVPKLEIIKLLKEITVQEDAHDDDYDRQADAIVKLLTKGTGV